MKELNTKLKGNANVQRNLTNYLDKPYAGEGNRVFNDKSWNLETGHPEYEATSAPKEGGKIMTHIMGVECLSAPQSFK